MEAHRCRKCTIMKRLLFLCRSASSVLISHRFQGRIKKKRNFYCGGKTIFFKQTNSNRGVKNQKKALLKQFDHFRSRFFHELIVSPKPRPLEGGKTCWGFSKIFQKLSDRNSSHWTTTLSQKEIQFRGYKKRKLKQCEATV